MATAGAATLELGDPQSTGAAAATYPLRLGGSSGVVAMQFDVTFPAPFAIFNAPALKAVANRHQMTYRELSAGVLRVVMHSGANAALPQDLFPRPRPACRMPRRSRCVPRWR